MSDDESSALSSVDSLSPPPSGDESDVQLKRQDGILKFFHAVPKKDEAAPKEDSPPPRKREPSPPHEYVLADNPDIAFIVMFRAKFNDIFSKNLATFGPQELEREIVDSTPGDRVELFLCAILKLLLNRQQEIKIGHYNRAVEDAIKSHESSWPSSWNGTSPLAGGATFVSMTPVQRLDLLRTFILWTMQYCKTVKEIIDSAYKNKRMDDDLNQPLSVQPLGSDSDRRRYFLVEGPGDTSFRIYRESNPAGFQRTWWSVAGSIEEVNALTDKLLTDDGGPKARKLSQRLQDHIPHFEDALEKLRRREYRLARKQQFKRPEPGFSLYEGRTRGKRAKYTFDDDDYDFNSDSTATRRSTRHGTQTPAEPAGPVTTSRGRQIRAPNRLNADMPDNGSGATDSVAYYDGDTEMRDDGAPAGLNGRPRRSAAVNHGTNGWSGKSSSEKTNGSDDFDSDAADDSEPDFGDDEEGDEHVPDESEDDDDEFDEDADMVDGDEVDSGLVVKLPVKVSYDRHTGKYSKADGPANKRNGDSAQLSPGSSESSKPGERMQRQGTPPKLARPQVTLQSPIPDDDDGVSVGRKLDQAKSTDKPFAQPTSGANDSGPDLPTTSLAIRSPEKPSQLAPPIDV
ncbi:hypothetical protein MCOR08_009078 [Pyricularia oryzae]|nr:hypothetical protein MCOR08_009078 [Pyricularia oryzae]